jgi:hypothetical protein
MTDATIRTDVAGRSPASVVMPVPWLPPSENPGDGESIWIVVREWDGEHTHVEYAQTWHDVPGVLVHRYEGEKDDYGEPWPPKDVIAWTPCDVPVYEEPERGRAENL